MNGVAAILITAGIPGTIALSASLIMWCFSSFSSSSLALFAGTIFSTSNASFKSFLSSLSAGSCKSTSAAWRLMLAQCTTLDENLDTPGRHRASFSDTSARFKIPYSASWSVHILFRAPFKCDLSIETFQTTARHFCARYCRGVVCRWGISTNNQFVSLALLADAVRERSQLGDHRHRVQV